MKQMPPHEIILGYGRRWPETIGWDVRRDDQNDGVRSCRPYSTCFTANIAGLASPKCGSSFWSRLRPIESQKRIATLAILPAPLTGTAVYAPAAELDSTQPAT